MKKSNELLQRIAGANGSQDERITVSLDRRVLPILEKYRAREVVDGGKTRRASLGETAVELIEAADELLLRYARERTSDSARDISFSNSGPTERPGSDPNDGEAGVLAK